MENAGCLGTVRAAEAAEGLAADGEAKRAITKIEEAEGGVGKCGGRVRRSRTDVCI